MVGKPVSREGTSKELVMTADTETVCATLQRLSLICQAEENGYRMAADQVRNLELAALFRRYAAQRAQFAADLQGELRRVGGESEPSGRVTGLLWRGWANLKAVLSGGDESAIISACERSEDAARESYREALQQPLPREIHALLEQQYAAIQEAHERIRALELAATRS